MREEKNINKDRKCNNCEHYAVCSIVRHILPIQNEYTEDTKPFDINDIAKICRYYSNMNDLR